MPSSRPELASPKRILVASTFTATPLEQPFNFWFDQLGSRAEAGFPGYQQLFQQLLNPDGDFARNRDGVNVALFRLEDLGDSDWEASLHELVTALISASKRFSTPLIVCACPSSDSANESVVRQLTGYRNLYVIDSDQVITDYQVAEIYDPIGERAAHIPYTTSFYAGLATQIVRTVLALDRPPVKVVAVDCDNTLWTGVCGEDGPEAIIIDHGRRLLQERLLKLKNSGILLAIVSKNNEADVCETFAKHPEMVLRWNDINVSRINWQAKSRNLISLADELNLGPDSFVFLEDDSKEAAEVRQGCPKVATLQIPASSPELPAFLNHAWIFDQVRAPTSEDQSRSRMYSEEAERKLYEQQASSFQDFVEGLNLQTEFLPIDPDLLSRASQLTLRTNQMNTTLERLLEPQLLILIEGPNVQAWVISVSDRFGDYGIVGLLMLDLSGPTATVRNFMLSCRALGRGVEHRMLAHAAQAVLAHEPPISFVEVLFVVGPRNNPAIQFLQSIPFGSQVGDVFRFRARELARLKFTDLPSRAPQPTSKLEEVQGGGGVSKIDYQLIATEFSTAAEILRAIEAQSKSNQQDHAPVIHPPQTDLEHGLAAIWCELLRINRVDVEDDFFDLGGHSLLAVQLLSRIHRDLDVDLPDSVIYADKLRISSLARTIELYRLGFGDQEGFESALAEIESLSDEEVSRLLSEETAG